jgi:hypothetical protein
LKKSQTAEMSRRLYSRMPTITKRRVEVIAFERERIVRRPLPVCCPVCELSSELLTVRQAGALVQVAAESIYRWLAQGKAHGVKTSGGQHRICRHSLFRALPLSIVDARRTDNEPL